MSRYRDDEVSVEGDVDVSEDESEEDEDDEVEDNEESLSMDEDGDSALEDGKQGQSPTDSDHYSASENEGQEEDEQLMEVDDEDFMEKNSYENPNNSNNVTGCMRLVDQALVDLADGRHDGNTYCFVCPTQGAALSPEALEALFALNFILSFAPSSKRLLETSELRPEFQDGKDRVLKNMYLVHDHVVTDVIAEDTCREALEQYGAINNYPHDANTNVLPHIAPNTEASDLPEIRKKIRLGDIFLSPVRVKMEKVGTEEPHVYRVYWLIMFRSIRNFDFTGHIEDVHMAYAKNAASALGKRQLDQTGMGLEIVRRVILLTMKMSPSCRKHMETLKGTNKEPWDLFNPDIPTPCSLEITTSIFEAFRGMQHPPDAHSPALQGKFQSPCSTASVSACNSGFS